MFKKLLSNLPFNPSLINQVSFYMHRLRQETTIRRLSFIFIALTMIIQVVAIVSPAQPTLARAGNDILPGGASSQQDIVNHCIRNDYGFATILAHFAITCNNLSGGTVRSIRSIDYGGQLYSMGRLPYGKPGEVTVNVAGAGNFYMRPLWSWDTNGASTYTALTGYSSFATPFFVLFDCGNIVIVGRPAPPPPPAPPAKCPLDNGILNSDVRCVPCPYNSSIRKDNPSCKPCDKSQNSNDQLACLILSKSAVNITRNGQTADGTTAQGGDTIQYTLRVQNQGKATVKGFVIQDNLTDILEYSDITDMAGASLSSDKIINWPAVDISANTTISRTFSVRIKNPVPQTPVSASNPGSFDLTMTNVYGNVINIKLPPTTVKTTEQVVGNLPNTGPGTSLIIGFGVTTVMAYFFARSRVMAKELAIVRNEYTAGGL